MVIDNDKIIIARHVQLPLRSHMNITVVREHIYMHDYINYYALMLLTDIGIVITMKQQLFVWQHAVYVEPALIVRFTITIIQMGTYNSMIRCN